MQRVFVALALAAMVAGAMAFDSDVDSDADADVAVPPRPGAKLVRATVFGAHRQTVNIVPKGDLRARVPTVDAPIAPVNPPMVDSVVVPNGRLSPLAPFNGRRGEAALAVPVPAPATQPAQHAGMGTAAMNRDVAGPGSLPSEPSNAPKVPPALVPPAMVSPATKPGPVSRLVRRMGADYGDNKCLRQGGQCQHTATCGGIVTKGICPGPSFITCCTYTSTACAAIKGSCKDTSTCLGTVVRGLCPGGNNIACCTARVGTDGDLMSASAVPAASQGGNCLANFNGKALADRAVKFQSEYRNNGVRWAAKLPHYGLPPTVKQADATSFVTSVLDSLSWNCLFAAGRTTSAMIPQMKVRGGFHTAPKLGDVVMWEKQGAAIVTELCAANTVRSVMFTEQSGAADTGCVTTDNLKAWGDGDFLGFWTPW